MRELANQVAILSISSLLSTYLRLGRLRGGFSTLSHQKLRAFVHQNFPQWFIECISCKKTGLPLSLRVINCGNSSPVVGHPYIALVCWRNLPVSLPLIQLVDRRATLVAIQLSRRSCTEENSLNSLDVAWTTYGCVWWDRRGEFSKKINPICDFFVKTEQIAADTRRTRKFFIIKLPGLRRNKPSRPCKNTGPIILRFC